MRRRALAWLAAGAWVAAPTVTAAPQVFELDPAHSFVWVEVLHFGTSTLNGRFGPIQGAVMLDRVAGRGRLALRIDLRTLDTGVPALDRRMRAPDLLHSDPDQGGDPEATYVAERFRFEVGVLAEVRGEFRLRGVSSALSLHAERFVCRDVAPPWAEVCGGDFVGQLKRSDFGATFGLPFVADAVTLRVQVEGRRR